MSAGEERQAVVAIAARVDEVRGRANRRWLERARATPGGRREEWLPRIVRALGLPPLRGGLAALRFLEQSGTPAPGWVAAADPVWLQAEMNRLRLHAMPEAALSAEDVRETFEWLAEQLDAGDTGHRFLAVGGAGYLCGPPMPTAELSPALAQGAAPERWLPEGPSAREHHRLLAEVQMCLHDSDLNRRRLAAGAPPLNALWVWGGGEAPPAERGLPMLFADDPVVRGFWRRASGDARAWPGGIQPCVEAGPGFVALAPAGDPDLLLAELRAAMQDGALPRLSLLFADGATVALRRMDRLRFWRRARLSPDQEP